MYKTCASTTIYSCLCLISLSVVHVSGVCTTPAAYKSKTWFQLYSSKPVSSTTAWVYGVYNDDSTIVTSRSDNVTFLNIKYQCESSVEVDSFYYYLFSQQFFTDKFCAKSKLTPDGSVLFVTEVKTTATTAADCAAQFTQDCFGANGQTPTCSAVWKPRSDVTVPPSFNPIPCPFQGVYQLSVTRTTTECTANPTSNVTVLGSVMQISACTGEARNALYKNRPIFTEAMKCLGDLDGSVLTAAEQAAGTRVLLLVSADKLTLYCAKYIIAPNNTIQMTIDVSSETYASCGLPTANTVTENKFVNLTMEPAAVTTLSPGMSTTAPAATTTGRATATTATTRATSTVTTATTGTVTTARTTTPSTTTNRLIPSSSTPGPPSTTTTTPTTTSSPTPTTTTRPTTTTPITTTTTPTTTTPTTTTSTTTRPTTATPTTTTPTTTTPTITTSTTTTPTTTTSTTTRPTTTTPNTQTTTRPTSVTTIILPTPTSSQARLSTFTTPAGTNTGSSSASGASPMSTPSMPTSGSSGVSTGLSGVTARPTTLPPAAVCAAAGLVCTAPLQCNVEQGVPSCGCPPGTTLTGNATTNATCSSSASANNQVVPIILGILGALVATATVIGLCICCAQRGGGASYSRRRRGTEFIETESPAYIYNVQPATFPSRGNIYGGTLGIGNGGYAAQNLQSFTEPAVGYNSYVLVKSTIPPK